MDCNSSNRRFLAEVGQNSVQSRLKRAIDVVVACSALAILGPLLAVIAVIVALDLRISPIFIQTRVGKDGQLFEIYKFRTMHQHPANCPGILNHSAISHVGRLLRASSIDELPQLWNVVRGDMSLVGPRPHEMMHDHDLAKQAVGYHLRRAMRPGITGLAQVRGYRGQIASPVDLEQRLAADLEYVQTWSLSLDLWILWMTLFSPTAHRNAA